MQCATASCDGQKNGGCDDDDMWLQPQPRASKRRLEAGPGADADRMGVEAQEIGRNVREDSPRGLSCSLLPGP